MGRPGGESKNDGPTTDQPTDTQHTPTVNHGHQQEMSNAQRPAKPDLGVKGSQVQILSARPLNGLVRASLRGGEHQFPPLSEGSDNRADNHSTRELTTRLSPRPLVRKNRRNHDPAQHEASRRPLRHHRPTRQIPTAPVDGSTFTAAPRPRPGRRPTPPASEPLQACQSVMRHER